MAAISIIQLAANKSQEEAASIVKEHFGGMAYDASIFIRAQIPMYTGKLNPTWIFWDNVICILEMDTTLSPKQSNLITPTPTQ